MPNQEPVACLLACKHTHPEFVLSHVFPLRRHWLADEAFLQCVSMECHPAYVWTVRHRARAVLVCSSGGTLQPHQTDSLCAQCLVRSHLVSFHR